MKIKSTLRVPKVRFVQKLLEKTVVDVLKGAAKEFIHSALASIPVWSAASHHTLAKLAEDAGVTITTVPRPSSPSGWKIPDRRELGRSHAGGGIISRKGEVVMEYSTTLDYLIRNELGIADVVTPKLLKDIPYNFREAAQEAAFQYAVKTLQERMPRLVASFITVQKV